MSEGRKEKGGEKGGWGDRRKAGRKEGEEGRREDREGKAVINILEKYG